MKLIPSLPSLGRTPTGPTTDLGAQWDTNATRQATVLISPGRIEILLLERDAEWVEQALDTIASANLQEIVVACPSPPAGEGPRP